MKSNRTGLIVKSKYALDAVCSELPFSPIKVLTLRIADRDMEKRGLAFGPQGHDMNTPEGIDYPGRSEAFDFP